jgi:hypothetical protein
LFAPAATQRAQTIVGFCGYLTRLDITRHWNKAGEILNHAMAIAETAKRTELIDWVALLKGRLAYRAGIGTVDRAIALTMGQDLRRDLRENKIPQIPERGAVG